MTWRELPPPSVFDRLTLRGAERDFAERVERAFPIDPDALARVRDAVLAKVPNAAPRVLSSPRFRSMPTWQRSASIAMAVAVVAVAGAVMAGGRSGSSIVATGAGVVRPAQAVLLDRSAARLGFVLATIQARDPATVATMLADLRSDFLHVQTALRRPGADLAAAATSLRVQAGDLATMAAFVPAADLGLYTELSGQLDQIIATLPDPAGGGSTHPGGGNGQPNGNSGGNGNGNGQPNGKGGGNGKPDGTPGGGNDNPNANPGGNAKPHATPRGTATPRGNGKPAPSNAGGKD